MHVSQFCKEGFNVLNIFMNIYGYICEANRTIIHLAKTAKVLTLDVNSCADPQIMKYNNRYILHV